MKNSISKLLKIKVSLLLIIVIIGCEGGFLDPTPKTSETTATFFKTEDHFLQAVGGAYDQLQQWVLQAHELEELRSDNTSLDNGLNRGVLLGRVEIDWFVLIGEEFPLERGWNIIYRGIKDVNVPLSEIEDGLENEILNPTLAHELEGELKFLRGFFHFTAVRLWGSVPLILEPFTASLSTFEIEQSPKDDIINAIIQDLEDAKSLLPESRSGNNLGRATSAGAKALLAKVYFWKGDYVNAEINLRDIVNSNQFSLLDNYADIFDPHNKFNDEIIHEVPFREGPEGESSNFPFQFAPVGSFPEVIPVLVSDGTWGRNLPTRQMLDAYDEDDLRKDASIGFFVNSEGVNVPYVKKWEEVTDENFARANHNWPLIRYADVLLMLAQSINEQGYNPEEPFNLLNQVRNRAGLPSLSSSDAPNQQELRQVLLDERRFELAFENHRWYDLISSGKAVEVMRAHGELASENPTTPFTRSVPLHANPWDVQEYQLVYPIPRSEITRNPNMEQNPGYN